VVGVAGPHALQVRRFFQARPFPADLLDRSRRLEDRGCQVVRPGESATLLAGHDVVTVSAKDGPTVALVLEVEESLRMSWRYDGKTLLPVSMVASSGEAARLEFALGVLARLGDQRSTTAVQELFWHPDHVVRWAAVRTLMKLDRSAGLDLLEAALRDPHPHVRQAARTAYQRLGAEAPLLTLAA
jgi:hypothetical protein